MSKTKSQLETELRSLRAKLANAEKLAIERLNRLNDMQMDFNAAEDARREAIKQRDAALQDRNAAKKHVAKLEETVDDRNGKITRLHEERDALRIETARLQMYANKNEHTIETLRRMVAGLRAGQDTLERKETAYKASIDELTAQRDTAEAERDEYAGKLTEAEANLATSQAQYEQAVEENNRLQHDLSDINRLQTARREDMQLHDNLQSKLNACEAERDDLQTRLVAAESLAIELRDRAENLEYGIADRNAKITRLHDERDAARNAAAQAKADCDNTLLLLNEALEQRDEYAAKLVEKGAVVSFIEGQLAARDAELKSARDLLDAREVRARSTESRADYWEIRAREAMRPWWRRTLDGLCSFTSEGGAS